MRACRITAAAALATRSTKSSVSTSTPVLRFLRMFSEIKIAGFDLATVGEVALAGVGKLFGHRVERLRQH